MAVQENEELFLVLNLLKEPDPQYLEQLVSEGYLDENQANTPKAEKFINDFINERIDAVFEAVAKQGSYFKDKGYVLLQAGLKNPLSAEVILEELVKLNKLKKKDGHGYIVRCGFNHPPQIQ